MSGNLKLLYSANSSRKISAASAGRTTCSCAREAVYSWILAAPVETITLRQRDLFGDLLACASSTAPARSRPSTENCTPM